MFGPQRSSRTSSGDALGFENIPYSVPGLPPPLASGSPVPPSNIGGQQPAQVTAPPAQTQKPIDSATAATGDVPVAPPPVPTPGNSYNEMSAAAAKATQARGRLSTIFTSLSGLPATRTQSLSRQMLTGY